MATASTIADATSSIRSSSPVVPTSPLSRLRQNSTKNLKVKTPTRSYHSNTKTMFDQKSKRGQIQRQKQKQLRQQQATRADSLSRLLQYPPMTSNTNNNQLSPSLREQYASAAESIKNILISDLTSGQKDVEAMVDLANNAFVSLDWLHVDYSDLYGVVRDHISSHSRYSFVKEERERMQNELSCLENVCARVKEASESLKKAGAELSDAVNRFCSLKTMTGKTPVWLKNFLSESARVRRRVEILREKYIAESVDVDNHDTVLNKSLQRLELCKSIKLSIR